ncbi:MAG: phospholipase D-like domain-containing protein [Verrucomicrobium sp.]
MQLILNAETYDAVLLKLVPEAKRFLWVVTADLKDLFVEGDAGKFVPFLAVLAEKLRQGVEVRLIHAKEPGPRFREDFDKFPEFVKSDLFERILCPRMHMKAIVADGRVAYIGSANLTGAGMGAKAEHRRNFEAGFITEDPAHIREFMAFLDSFYLGDWCAKCQRREVCPEPIVQETKD